MILQHTVACNPKINGAAERMNRTLVDKARTVLINSRMEKQFKREALLYSLCVTNRSSEILQEKTDV